MKAAYHFLFELPEEFDAIVWFSAKTNRLTETKIVTLEPEIKDYEQFVHDLLDELDSDALQKLKSAKADIGNYKNYLYSLFSSQRCLIVIDNLETIILESSLIDFIKDIPRPSKVLITSRMGLGEVERKIAITDLEDRDAVALFRRVSRERERQKRPTKP